MSLPSLLDEFERLAGLNPRGMAFAPRSGGADSSTGDSLAPHTGRAVDEALSARSPVDSFLTDAGPVAQTPGEGVCDPASSELDPRVEDANRLLDPATAPGEAAFELDAMKLADICLRLRAETQLRPAWDLWDRLQERVRLYKAESGEEWENLADLSHASNSDLLFSELVELCSGAVDDTALDLIEKRLATSDETPKTLRDVGRLSGALSSLRGDSELKASQDAFLRFQQRVQAALSQGADLVEDELPSALRANRSAAPPPFVMPPSPPLQYVPLQAAASWQPQAMQSQAWPPSPYHPGYSVPVGAPYHVARYSGVLPATEPATEDLRTFEAIAADRSRYRPANRSPLSWVALAASVAIAVGVWRLMFGSVDDGLAVLYEARSVHSWNEFQALSPRLNAAVGELLLQLDRPATDPIADRRSAYHLANWHLVADMARQGDPADWPTARALMASEGAVRGPSGAIAWTFTRQAYANSASASPAAGSSVFGASSASAPPWRIDLQALSEFDRQLHAAFESRDFARVTQLTHKRGEMKYLLIRVWAQLAASADFAVAREGLKECDQASRQGGWPLEARIFLAGLHRSAGQPAVAIRQFEALVSESSHLAFQIGHLYERHLQNEELAANWFRRLGDEHRVFRELGLTQSRLAPLFVDLFQQDLSAWRSAGGDHGSFSIVREGSFDALHQTEMADATHVRTLITGDPSWRDYEIRLNFRFDRAGAGDSRIGLFACYQSEEESYRLAIGRESLGFRRREPRSWGGYETVNWPKLEPRYPLLPLGVWHTVRFRVESIASGVHSPAGPNSPAGVRLFAKVWRLGSPEPLEWNLVSEDTQSSAYVAGQVGLMITNAEASVTNFRVFSLNPTE